MENKILFGNDNLGLQVGISNGPITAQFGVPERPETPPNPISTTPFRRDPDFIDRGTLLDQIHKRCSKPASRIALVGLGGVGKSQLAIEYSYRIREQSPETWVLWIHGSNAARFEESCQDIANRLKIPGRNVLKVNIFQLICNWLYDERRRWILFLDSVDHDRFLHEPPPASQDDPNATRKPFSACIPTNANGTVIMTTRSRNVAARFVREDEIINVQPMEETHALALFERKLGMEEDKETTRKLAAALEFMPLAIVQAAAYIKKHCSVSQYLENFLSSDQKKMSLLNKEYESTTNLYRDREAKNSVMVTWQISFDHIKEIRPSATDLLSLMSFFDRQGIDRALLENQANSGTGHGIEQGLDEDCANNSDEESTAESNMDDRFQDDINTLCDYMLIYSDRVTVEMHGLVQLAMRKWLEAHEQLEQWKEVFIRIISRQFPTGKYENWEQCQRVFRHARSAAAQRPKEETVLRDWALLMYNAAWYASERGNISDSKQMAEESMKARNQLFGSEHRLTMNSKSMLGLAYQVRGCWKEAEEIIVQVLETCKQTLGPEHPDTITSMSNLALTYQNQGHWKKAEELQMEVLEACKQIMGPEHPGTLTSMSNLASTHGKQGHWKKAEALQMQVTETHKQILGPKHPETRTSMSILVLIYGKQGQWTKAEELQMEVTEACKQIMGPEHPDTLTSMGNLAFIYRNQGQWTKAEALQMQALEAHKQTLGPKHPTTLTSMSDLALTYQDQGHWKKAEELQMEVTEACKQIMGPEHPDTLTSMSNLESTYWNQGHWMKAEELQMQALEAHKQTLGPKHPITLTSMSNLVLTYQNQGHWKKAEELQIEVLEACKQILGPEHPITLNSMKNLALTHGKQGQWMKAEVLQIEVLEACKQILGPEHPITLNSMRNLAQTWKSQGKQDNALTLMTDCVRICRRTIGHDHPDTISSSATLINWQEEIDRTPLSLSGAPEKSTEQEHPHSSTGNSTPTSVANQPNLETANEQSIAALKKVRRRKRDVLFRFSLRN